MQELQERPEFDHWLSLGENRKPAAIQALDLSDLAIDDFHGPFTGALFLGCPLSDNAVAAHLVGEGAVVLPVMAGYEFAIHRATTYRPDELFHGFDPADPDGYQNTLDYKVYAQYLADGKANPASIQTSLARRLHDHSITDALMEDIEGREVVAVMGGHGMKRADGFYAAVARISRNLTRDGYLMVSGGGPGAMEATHLGAYFACRPDAEMDAAIDILKVRPPGADGGEYAEPDWLHRAWRVVTEFPIPQGKEEASKSVGIPTWLYGHEPPTPFATRIAKYFANSVREDGLLAIAEHGVIFAPGSAGTIQEVFQDAAQNHYGTTGVFSPMILFGKEYWTKNRPVWPLLETVSRDQPYGKLVALTDDEQEIVSRIRAYDPKQCKLP